MAANEPLLPSLSSTARSKASTFYNADEYLKELKLKFEQDHEIADVLSAMPDQDQAGVKRNEKDKLINIEAEDVQRSKITGRLFPVSNKPDPMPKHLSFMFTRITAEQGMYMWRVLTGIFFLQCAMVLAYAAALASLSDVYWWPVTIAFGAPFAYLAVQHIYVDHDVMHGVTFPPYWWQKFLTHPFSDFLSLPWEEFVLEHSRHHASTVDLLIQGEFGWDPEMPLYWLQQWSDKWYCLMLTMPLIPILHFLGLNDTGGLFCLEWYMHFPEEGAGGKCNKEFWTKWLPRRMTHHFFVAIVWTWVFAVGQYATGSGLQFVLTVSICARIGYGSAWLFITNFTHSLPWNRFLANDPERTWPRLHAVMACVLGGRHRWNEMLFHDIHHAFPNAMGTLSQRGRFNDWQKVHAAAVEILSRGLFKPNGDAETAMEKEQKKRSLKLSGRISATK